MLFDGMAVVNEQAFYKDSINNCSDLADSFANASVKKLHSYAISYVLFNKYTVKSSMTDDTRQVENHCSSQRLKTPYRSEIVW